MWLGCPVGHDCRPRSLPGPGSRKLFGGDSSSFLGLRLDGLTDEPRPGAPRKVSDAEVERVIAKTLESTPKGATHWSTRSMAEAAGMSPTTVRRIWHTFALQPHRADSPSLNDLDQMENQR